MRKTVIALCVMCMICATSLAQQRVKIPPATVILSGQTTTNAGTRVQLSATSTGITSVSVKALSTNTGIVYVGDVTVDSSNGRELQTGESIDIDISNLNLVYIDVSVNSEGVSYAGIR